VEKPARENLDMILREHFLRSKPSQTDEAGLLSLLSHAWATQPSRFYTKPSHHSSFGSVLGAWIEWRRHVGRIKEYAASLPSDSKLEWVYRAALCREYRESRKKFLDMRVEVNGKEKESRNVLCVMLGNVMGLDAGRDMEIVKALRENLSRVDPEIEELEWKDVEDK
jgi:hypothetical protein